MVSEETDHRASYVHIAVRVAFRRRPPLYAREVHSQYPRQQPVASTPVASAVWPESKDLSLRRVKPQLPVVSHHLHRLQCAQGEDASNKGSLRSPNETQARDLVP